MANYQIQLLFEKAIAAHEAEQWNFKKPRSNDKRLWGKRCLVERMNYLGEQYFSIEEHPLLGKIIRWRELPAHYQPKEGGER